MLKGLRFYFFTRIIIYIVIFILKFNLKNITTKNRSNLIKFEWNQVHCRSCILSYIQAAYEGTLVNNVDWEHLVLIHCDAIPNKYHLFSFFSIKGPPESPEPFFKNYTFFVGIKYPRFKYSIYRNIVRSVFLAAFHNRSIAIP